jgi:hypothetical protein
MNARGSVRLATSGVNRDDLSSHVGILLCSV